MAGKTGVGVLATKENRRVCCRGLGEHPVAGLYAGRAEHEDGAPE